MAEKNEAVFMITHGSKNAEIAAIPFVMAVTGARFECRSAGRVSGIGVMLALKGWLTTWQYPVSLRSRV